MWAEPQPRRCSLALPLPAQLCLRGRAEYLVGSRAACPLPGRGTPEVPPPSAQYRPGRSERPDMVLVLSSPKTLKLEIVSKMAFFFFLLSGFTAQRNDG